jgi:hypothetical protein
MSNLKLKKGDRVRVMDAGLLMLQKFAPPGAKPNNEGVVFDIWDDGTIEEQTFAALKAPHPLREPCLLFLILSYSFL